ncbi:MAG: deoxyribonuclease IV [Phycisphaerae bacterium]|nr:deoxyribonuclease IV [Phycisphaerae bacterium]
MSVAGGLHNALTAAAKLRCRTVQVFVKNQRQWRAAALSEEAVELWRTTRVAKRITGPIVAHASYLVNLASVDRALREKSQTALVDELARCDRLGIEYLVVHPGAAGEQRPAQALKRVAAALNRIHKRQPELRTMTLLETTAGQGTALGRSFEELGDILARIAQPRRVGICIDTCHVFAAGYDIRDPSEYDRMIASAWRAVGLERIRCWHLNDCAGELGARRDRHAHIGRGRIGIAGFHHLLSDPRFLGVPMILETPKGQNEIGRDWDAVNLRRLRSLSTRTASRRKSSD